ncbi:Hypothetical predicted protein [Olea europaea subsp. europaea]|uniref:Uncharacterized protein n=1 Tax=Olea europaea subsp. europaea TaxID=158383 RepID=A0A8S0T9M0_OLEEU|nr:Hypothetical predicted protein [Olea europaea subsp. europaea]
MKCGISLPSSQFQLEYSCYKLYLFADDARCTKELYKYKVTRGIFARSNWLWILQTAQDVLCWPSNFCNGMQNELCGLHEPLILSAVF